MSAPRIPSELTDAIIDCLREDNQALGRCSTVCRAWLARSRYHHFRHVTLSFKDRNCIRTLFDPSLSTTIPYIRSLHLVDGRAPSERWLNDTMTWLAMFSAVESLTMENAAFLRLDSSTTTIFLSSFPVLRELRVHWAYFRSFVQLIHMVDACPLLEHMSLDGLQYWDQVDHQLSLADPRPHRLVTLELGLCDKVAITDWLLAGPNALALTRFRATSIALDQVASTGTLLRSLAPTLEHLEFGLDRYHVESAVFIGTPC